MRIIPQKADGKGICMFKCLMMLLWCAFLSFGEDDGLKLDNTEPPSGNRQFYSGLGLTIAGTAFNVIGIYALANVGDDEYADSPKDIYGGRYDSTVVLSRKSKAGFGWTCLIAGVCFDAFGIPLLVKGRKLKNKRNEWEERTKISLYMNPFTNIYSLRSTILF